MRGTDARGGELWLINSNIPEYLQANRFNHETRRPRKLLLHRREIEQWASKVAERGLSVVPLRLYFKDGRVKVAVSIAKGKKDYDKRETIKRRETDRETRAAIKSRR